MLAARLRWAARSPFASIVSRRHAATAAALATSEPPPKGVAFASLQGKVSQQTLDAIISKPFNLTTMSPVQAEVLPLLPELAKPWVDGHTGLRDLLVRAKTGTGKTLGFLVPSIEARLHVLQERGGDNPFRYARENAGTLIISPTRELATQIAAEAMKLTHHHNGFDVQLLTGGNSKRLQMRNWMRGRKDIVVATPGRLRDLLDTEPEVTKVFRNTATFVLDEADTLLEMGFREDMEAIKAFLPPTPQRQTFLFSATVSPEIREVARSMLAKNHEFIDCVREESSPVHAHVEQYHTVVPSASDHLPHILRLIMHDQLLHPTTSKIIVFFPTTKMTQLFSTLVSTLAANTFPNGRATRTFELHSKRTQEARTRTSDEFRKTTGPAVLVTSDVSARGVDYPGVTRVIQVGIPAGREHYIHRVGRTGRAGGAGRGDLVLLPWEIGFVTWQLTDVPMRPLTLNELKDQIVALAEKVDADPSAIPRRPNGPPAYAGELVPLANKVDDNVKALLGRLDAGAIRETFLSMLGYYLSKTPELRVEKPVVLQGCQDWTTQACGLEVPPYVSMDFLTKLGVSDGRTKHFGKRRMDRDRSYRQDQPVWVGRGVVRERVERRAAAGVDGARGTILHSEHHAVDLDRDSEAAEYRSPRYRDRGSGRAGDASADGPWRGTRRYDNERGFGAGRDRDAYGGGGRREGGGGAFGSRGSSYGRGDGGGFQSRSSYGRSDGQPRSRGGYNGGRPGETPSRREPRSDY